MMARSNGWRKNIDHQKKDPKRRGMRRKNRRKLLCAFRDRFCCCCSDRVVILHKPFFCSRKIFQVFCFAHIFGPHFSAVFVLSFSLREKNSRQNFVEQKNASNLLFQFEDYQRSNQISTENHKDSFRRSILIFRCGRCRRMCTISSYIKTQK